jgi:hypothetical protein
VYFSFDGLCATGPYRERAKHWEVTACSASRTRIACGSGFVVYGFFEETFPLHENGMEIVKKVDIHVSPTIG